MKPRVVLALRKEIASMAECLDEGGVAPGSPIVASVTGDRVSIMVSPRELTPPVLLEAFERAALTSTGRGYAIVERGRLVEIGTTDPLPARAA